MGFPKCEVPTRKQWSEMRDKLGGKDGLSKKSMGKALDAFHAAIAKAEKSEDIEQAELAVDSLTEVATGYMNDIKKLDKYPKVVEHAKLKVIEGARLYKLALDRMRVVDTTELSRQATEIAEDWIRQVNKYQSLLEDQKKEALAEVKATLDRIEQAVAKGQASTPAIVEEFEFDVDQAGKRLRSVESFCTETFGKFDSWALGECRKSMGVIGPRLGLGDPQSAKYLSVARECKSLLTEVAEAMNEVDNLWKRDIQFQIERLKGRVESIGKVLRGEQGNNAALARRLSDEVDRFVLDCDKLYDELKVSSDATWLPKAQQGALVSDKALVWSQHVVLYRKKLSALPKLLEIVEKNRKRVLKSVPDGRVEAFERSPVGQKMTQAEELLRQRLRQAGKLYDALLIEYKKHGYEA